MIPQLVVDWLHELGHGEVVGSQSVAGGCINNGIRVQTAGGRSFFLKTNSTTPPDMFTREAQGLAALRTVNGPRVPEVYLWSEKFLLLEDLAPSSRSKNYWQDFGRQFAVLHNYTNDKFGFENDNYIGSTPQPNSWTADGYQFFAQHRFGFQADLAARSKLLTPNEAVQVHSLASRLPDLVPEQTASILHGDLWSGNAISDVDGNPAFIDPAAYYGWAEADLAMTTLFGGFNPDFYNAYIEVRPLEKGWRERFPLYNLYHLLNHLNLFGLSYYSQVIQVLNRFG